MIDVFPKAEFIASAADCLNNVPRWGAYLRQISLTTAPPCAALFVPNTL